MMDASSTSPAWRAYTWWPWQDKKSINMLVDAKAHVPLKDGDQRKLLAGNLTGFWSKRIDGASRLLYQTSHNQIVVIAYRFEHPG